MGQALGRMISRHRAERLARYADDAAMDITRRVEQCKWRGRDAQADRLLTEDALDELYDLRRAHTDAGVVIATQIADMERRLAAMPNVPPLNDLPA